MQQWENNTVQMNEMEKSMLLQMQKSLIRGGRSWNEAELENKFISPLIILANIDDEQIGYFLERPLSAIIIGNFDLF